MAAGLEAVETHTITVQRVFASFDEFWEINTATNLKGTLAELDSCLRLCDSVGMAQTVCVILSSSYRQMLEAIVADRTVSVSDVFLQRGSRSDNACPTLASLHYRPISPK
jgi:hypothetical protein